MKVTTEMQGVERAQKRILKAVKFGILNKQDVQRSYRKVAQIFVRKARTMTKDYPKQIVIHRYVNSKPLVVDPGTLRRSFGTWAPNRQLPTILAGPRANYPMKRKVGKNSDAWFAHIVEEGDFPDAFGGKSASHPNYKITERAIKATQDAMRTKLYKELRSSFAKFMK